MEKNILKIPYVAVREDWNLLQQFLKLKGNPRYIIVGDVDLFRSKDIPNLGNLVGVEGDLRLNWSSIESLGELEFVGGYLGLWGCKDIKTLGKIKRVESDLNLDESSIESLGQLEYVGAGLNLPKCKNIKTLGNLKEVGDFLNLTDSSIESLGKLEYVGDDLLLNGTDISPSEINKVNVVGGIFR
jgi:hypothetical protein